MQLRTGCYKLMNLHHSFRLQISRELSDVKRAVPRYGPDSSCNCKISTPVFGVCHNAITAVCNGSGMSLVLETGGQGQGYVNALTDLTAGWRGGGIW